MIRFPDFCRFFFFKDFCDPVIQTFRDKFPCLFQLLFFFCFFCPQTFHLGCNFIVPLRCFLVSLNRSAAFFNCLLQSRQTLNNLFRLHSLLCPHNLHCLFIRLPLQNFLFFFHFLTDFLKTLLFLLQKIIELCKLLFAVPYSGLIFLRLLFPITLFFLCSFFLILCILQLLINFFQIHVQKTIFFRLGKFPTFLQLRGTAALLFLFLFCILKLPFLHFQLFL